MMQWKSNNLHFAWKCFHFGIKTIFPHLFQFFVEHPVYGFAAVAGGKESSSDDYASNLTRIFEAAACFHLQNLPLHA